MRASFPLHGPHGAGTTSECLLEVPFEAYTDSPETEGDSNKNNIRVETIPRGAQVGPQWPSVWRRTLAIFIPSLPSRRGDQDEDEDAGEDSLPLLSENPQHKKQWRSSRRSRWARCFVRGLIWFFVML